MEGRTNTWGHPVLPLGAHPGSAGDKPQGWGPHGQVTASAGWGWRNPAAGAKSAKPVLLGLMLSALINPVKIQLGVAHTLLPGKRGHLVVLALSSVTWTQLPAGSAASGRKR